MAFREYGSYDGMGLAELIREKQVSARELLDEAIARTAKVDPQINAVVVKHYDYAERQIDNGLPDGPFTGVPFLLKDLDILKGTRTTWVPASTRTMSPIIPAPSPGASSMPGSRSSEKAPVRNSD
jgi:amidase